MRRAEEIITFLPKLYECIKFLEFFARGMHHKITDTEGATVNCPEVKYSEKLTIQYRHELKTEIAFKKLNVSLDHEPPLS